MSPTHFDTFTFYALNFSRWKCIFKTFIPCSFRAWLWSAFHVVKSSHMDDKWKKTWEMHHSGEEVVSSIFLHRHFGMNSEHWTGNCLQLSISTFPCTNKWFRKCAQNRDDQIKRNFLAWLKNMCAQHWFISHILISANNNRCTTTNNRFTLAPYCIVSIQVSK